MVESRNGNLEKSLETWAGHRWRLVKTGSRVRPRECTPIYQLEVRGGYIHSQVGKHTGVPSRHKPAQSIRFPGREGDGYGLQMNDSYPTQLTAT